MPGLAGSMRRSRRMVGTMGRCLGTTGRKRSQWSLLQCWSMLQQEQQQLQLHLEQQQRKQHLE